MSQGYAVDFYGVATYGYSQPLDYSVAPFTATQSNYGSLVLNWKAPNSTPWKTMQLVSSLYGYPNVPSDGVFKLSISPTASVTNFEDTNLIPGKIYYYTIFLSLESPTWNVGTTYSSGTVVLSGGQYWESLTNSNVGNTPAVGSTFWANTQYAPIWFPAGYTASLVVTDYKYSKLLYDKTPQPYKIVASDIFTNASVDNIALLHYLSVFGFHLDMTKTEYDLYLQGNNPDVIAASNLYWLGAELGVPADFLAAPQYRRNNIKNATTNYQLKGTAQGLHNAIAGVSGWDSTISYSSNLMLNGDQSAFIHPSYDLWNNSITYFPNQLIQFNGYNYKCLVQSFGTAQGPTGTNTANTWWTPQVSTTTTQILDTTTLKNPKSFVSTAGGYSTWASTWTMDTNYGVDGALEQGILTGLPHPTNSAINNWNALQYQKTGSLGGPHMAIYSINAPAFHFPTLIAWSSGTNYVAGNYVITGVTTKWQAIKASGPGTPYGAVTPGTNELFWIGIPDTNPDYLKNDWFQDSIPVRTYPVWDSSISYAKGTQVLYFGIIYQALRSNLNSKPSGNYYATQDWIYIQPSDYRHTLSAYQTRVTTNTTAQTTLTDIQYLDVKLNPSVYSALAYSGTGLTSPIANVYRFITDYLDLNGVSNGTISTIPWVSSPAGLWLSSFGMASVNQAVAGTSTYSILRFAGSQSDTNSVVTFATDYLDTVHYGHGILFRYQDASNFWYTTRQSLYLVSGGVETLIASWTRLVDGDRMMVATSGSSITVSKYNRDGSGNRTNIATVTNATLSTANNYGLIQKYSPSGAV